MRFDEIDGEQMEEPGVVTAGLRALKRAGTLGYNDEFEGALESSASAGVVGVDDTISELGQRWASILRGGAGGLPTDAAKRHLTYEKARDNARAVDDATREAHPGVSTAVELGTAILHPINKLGGGGFWGAVRGGATQGAVQGLGESQASLTDGDVEDYVRAFGDTAKGAGLGGTLGAAGHGVGAGLGWVGRKGGQALEGARDRLFGEEVQETLRRMAAEDAPIIAQRDAEAAARAKAKADVAVRLEREHGQGLEMNKGVDRRAAKEAERAAQAEARAARAGDRFAEARTQVAPSMRAEPSTVGARPRRSAAPAVPEEPSTAQLQGYHRQAHGAVAERQLKANSFRREMPEANTALREDWQRYIDEFPEALENPPLARRMEMERNLRLRYGDELAERLMAERVGPDGAVRSRGLGAEPRTPPMGYEDVAAQGRAEQVARQGGGGSIWDEYEPRTLVEEPPTVRGRGVREVPLNELDDVPAYPRDPGRMASVQQGLDAGADLPPIRVGEGEDGLRELADGNHRLAAYRARGQESIPVDFESTAAAQVRPRARGTNINPRATAPVDAPAPGGMPESQPEVDVVLAQRRAAQAVRDLEGGRGPQADPLPMEDRTPAGVAPKPLPSSAPTRAEPRSASKGEPTRAEGRPRKVPVNPADFPPTKAGLSGNRDGSPLARIEGREPKAMGPVLAPAERNVFASPAGQRADAREASAFGDLARKGGQAMLDADNPFSAAMKGPWAATREAIRNPAVRARALALLRVHRLAQVNPAVFSRVGRALQQAAQSGPDEYATAVHVYNQTDPEYREAERHASEGLDNLDDAALEAELKRAGIL
jgi:hypothetical protein